MAQEHNIEQKLNDLLVSRNFHPELTGKDGRPSDAAEAKTFAFDYIAPSGKNYGTMVIVLANDNEMKVMYGDNLGKTMEGADKQSFFDFIQALHQFAVRNFWTFSSEDLSKLKYVQAGMAAIKEGLFEGYYGNRRVSYTGEATEARMMIRHNRVLGENDARFRYIESIYIETADLERFKLPFTNMTGARAMLEHVRQGGRPYDVRGTHISEMVSELKVLNRFNRASAGHVMEGVTQAIVEQAQAYYQSLRESLKRLGHGRGYSTYFEAWHPAEIGEHESLVEDIKTMFVQQTLDTRIEAALPLLARIQQQGNAMKEAEIFESWINNLAEGTWNLPETPEQQQKLADLMSAPLEAGADGVNATEQLYDLVGDDALFDLIEELAEENPQANIWEDARVMERLQQLGVEVPEPAEPTPADPEQGVAEGSKTPTDWMGVPTKLAKNDKKPIKRPSGYDEYIKQGAKHGFQDDPTNPLRKKVKEQGVAEGSESKKFKVTYELQNGDVKEKIMIGKDAKAVAKYFEFKYRHKPISVVEQGVAEGSTFPGTLSDRELSKVGRQIKSSQGRDSNVTSPHQRKDWYNPNDSRSSKQQKLDYLKSLKGSQGVTEAATPASVSKVLRLIDRHHPEWFDDYGMGEVEDTVVDMAEQGQFQGMSAQDAMDLVVQELESLYGPQGMTEGLDLDAMRKAAGLPVSEGRILDEGGETLGHIMDRFKHEVDQFEKGGDLDNDLYYALFDYYSDHGEIPYGIAKGRDGDPFEWVTDRLDQELGTGNHAPRVSEADALATFEVMSGFDAPVAEGSCNMTAEGEYCPEHALAECGGGMHEMGTVAGSVATVMGESQDSDALLARIKSLALVR
jgi:hypothetical protein